MLWQSTSTRSEAKKMQLVKKQIPLLVKIAAKMFLRWLVRQLEEELREGIRIKVRLDGQDYDILIKLTDHRNINTPYIIID
jgi:hypothetical protein